MEPTGPSRDTLRYLKEMLPSFIKGLEEKQTIGRGKPICRRQPRKTCPVCTDFWDEVMSSEEIAVSKQTCPRCQAEFDAGKVALVFGPKVIFLKDPALADLAGTVVPLTEQQFKQWEEKYVKLQRKHRKEV